MTCEHTYYCEGPGCDLHIRSTLSAPRIGWLRVVERHPGDRRELDFCSWECAIRYGATQPIPEVMAGL